jgi:uncharacterized protein YjiS (DUF1127 family)
MAFMTANDFRSLSTAKPGDSLPVRLLSTLQLWRRRARERAELAKLTSRDARDLGVDPGVLAYEASKPFWTA